LLRTAAAPQTTTGKIARAHRAGFRLLLLLLLQQQNQERNW